MNLNRLTALLLALAMTLTLSTSALAAEAELSSPAPTQLAAESDSFVPDREDAANDAESSTAADTPTAADTSVSDEADASTAAADPSAPDEADASTDQANPSAPNEADASPDQADPSDPDEADASPDQADPSDPDETALADQEAPQQTAQPAAIWWETAPEQFSEQVAYEYNGQERKPAYRVMRDGAQVEPKAEWTEQWYADEACTVPATDFVQEGVRTLRLMEGDTVAAQGSYRIVKATQSITVNSGTLEQKFQRGKTFELGAKSSGGGTLHFQSGDHAVVSVDEKGVCTMQGVGTATITVTADETEHFSAATGSVTVALYVKPRKLSYSKAYKKGKYYKALTRLHLTGGTGENAVDIALSQLGYREGRSSGQLSGSGRGRNMSNWTEYGRYYGMNHVPWCAIFVNWCAREAGASYGTVPKYCAVRYYHSYFKRKGRFHSWKSARSGSYRPKKGDIILYANSKNGVAHHIGFVQESSYEGHRVRITTVEGNTRDAVREVHMDLSQKSSGKHGGHYILGFASPNW